MINHINKYEKVENTFKEVQQEYQVFKKKISYENRNNLKRKIKEHRQALSELVTSVNNIFLR